jgi:hypothetical protein
MARPLVRPRRSSKDRRRSSLAFGRIDAFTRNYQLGNPRACAVKYVGRVQLAYHKSVAAKHRDGSVSLLVAQCSPVAFNLEKLIGLRLLTALASHYDKHTRSSVEFDTRESRKDYSRDDSLQLRYV